MIQLLAQLLWKAGYVRYAGTSALALCVDMGLFLVLCGGPVPLNLVSAVSYSTGILAHWLLSSRLVFGVALRKVGEGRGRQQIMFALSGLAGLAVTVAVVALIDQAGIDARIGKLAAVALSFQTSWWLRSRIVFA